MRMSRRLSLAGLGASILLLVNAASAADCDRACLNGFVDQYVEALIAHDPARLPLASKAKFTENGQEIPLGDALWLHAGGPVSYKLYFNDVEKGQTGFIGVIRDQDNPVILYLRLKVEHRRIAEIETIVARNDMAFNKPLDLKDKPIFSATVPVAERSSRQQMKAVMQAYLDAVTKAVPNDAIFDPNCQRVENGVITASNPDGDKMSKLSCGAQLHTGVSALLTGYHEPRYFVVDEERGLVGVQFFFDHSTKVESVTINYPDGSKDVRKAAKTPYSWMAGELFKIENGKIRQIEVVITRVPYMMKSGW